MSIAKQLVFTATLFSIAKQPVFIATIFSGLAETSLRPSGPGALPLQFIPTEAHPLDIFQVCTIVDYILIHSSTSIFGDCFLLSFEFPCMDPPSIPFMNMNRAVTMH